MGTSGRRSGWGSSAPLVRKNQFHHNCTGAVPGFCGAPGKADYGTLQRAIFLTFSSRER